VPTAEPGAPSAPTPASAPRAAPTGGARGALLVTAGILLSRVFGLVRQRVQAHYLGTSVFADILTAAFRVGNVTQNLLGEGTLSASFIPIYAKLRAEGRSERAAEFARSTLGLLLAIVAAASLVGALCAPWLTYLVAAGFEGPELASTVRVVRVVFPMTGLLVLGAWALGVLNAHRRFFLPYAAPVVWSLAQIAALIVVGGWLGQTGEPLAMAVAWGALAGAALQVAALLPGARALIGRIAPRFDASNPDVRKAARRLPGALLGRGVVQISGLIDTQLVSFLGAGAVATFGYAQTIYLLPMSLLGTGEAAAALPDMAGGSAEADPDQRAAALRARLGDSLARLAALTIPTTAAFVVLGDELVALLLQTGSFDRESTARVARVLAAYGFGLLANASVRVLSVACYALGDTRTPARYAVLRVAVSTAVAVALMRRLDVLGVVLGAVLAAWVEAVMLARRVRREIGGLGLARVRAGRIALLTAISAGAGAGAAALVPPAWRGGALASIVALGAFGAAFAAAAPLLGLFDVRALLRRR
jgi:putative peptidoglycan lipid II flippase